MFHQISNQSLYFQAKLVYLTLLKEILTDIDSGNARAAEQYQQLEDTWKEVQSWYERERNHG
jgi:hypothetical protein